MHLFLVRHGVAATESAPGVFTPDGELSTLGEHQASLTARRLAVERLTHVVSSPLIRALATATRIAVAAGDLPVDVWMELREGYGDVPGKSVPIHRGLGSGEFQRRFPRASLPPDVTPDGWGHGGDTYDRFFARCQEAACRLEAQFASSDRVAVVGHGGCLNYLVHALLGISPAAPTWFEMDNGAISRVRLVPESERRQGWPLYPPVAVEVLSLNDTDHLRTD